ncbi:hypothetical protein [Sphingobacterium tabacisoli]|uniref:Uncharacterized protein n=1 Tax=Sphingobacterium tabacisoli TaxID=2044855 RepID=A0ABW5L0V7_9SPHI|nr:hypothetical protein [Sphingobacterium tabacisoli]
MNLSELEEKWEMFTERLEENTKINKKILHEMMTHKPKRRINLLRWESGIRIVISVGLLAFLIVYFNAAIISFQGLTFMLFIILVVGVQYFDTFQLFRILSKIDLSKPVKENKMLFLTYEKNKLRVKKISTLYLCIIIPPLAIYSFCTSRGLLSGSWLEFIISVVLVAGGGILFSRFRNRLVQDQLRKLKEEIADFE